MKKNKKMTRSACMLLALAMAMAAAGCGSGGGGSDQESGEQTASEAAASSAEQTSGEGEGELAPGDAGDSGNAAEVGTEPVTVTMSGARGATDDWGGTDIIADIAELTGVSIECSPYTDDMWPDKFSLMLADDDLPDIILRPSRDLAQVADLGEKGYLLPLDEYLDYAPNLAKFMEEHPDYKRACTSDDGHIYTLVNWTDRLISETVSRTYVPTEWLENVGLENPKTIDEFYNMLKAFKEQDANGNGDPDDEIPMMFPSSGTGRNAIQPLLAAFGICDGTGADKYYALFEVKDGKVSLADTKDNYKAFLEFLHKLWDEELLYHGSFSTPVAQMREFVEADQVGVYGDASFKTVGDYGAKDYGLIGCMTSEWNDKPMLVLGNETGSTPKILVSAETEYPERIMQVIDLFFMDEYRNAGRMGFDFIKTVNLSEEVDFGDNTEAEEALKDFQIYPTVTEWPSEYETADIYRYQKRVINEGFDIAMYSYGEWEYVIDNCDPAYYDAFIELKRPALPLSAEILLNERNAEIVHEFPAVVIPADKTDTYNSLWTDISTYLATMSAQFITGESSIEDDWDEHLQTLDSMGLEELIAIEQEAYDNLMSH